MYKGYYGSNNETQVSKVFWHETGLVHGFFYLSAGFYLIKNNFKMSKNHANYGCIFFVYL